MTDIVCKKAIDFDSQRSNKKRAMLTEIEGLKTFEGKQAIILYQARG